MVGGGQENRQRKGRRGTKESRGGKKNKARGSQKEI